MLTSFSLKIRIFLTVVICCFSNWISAQDSLEFESERRLFFGVEVSAFKDFGKQANFYRGFNTFGIEELLSIPTIQSELYTKTGFNYDLEEYPAPMKFNTSIAIGLKAMFDGGDINYILSGHFSKLTTNGNFTLAATNPANPFGDDLIKVQSITGTERRTWIKAGFQFKNEINERNDFFIELAPTAIFQKALKNEVNIEGSTYSILVNNPGNQVIQTAFFGYGLNLGLGIQTMFLKNKITQFGINFCSSKLNMVKVKGLNYSGEIYLSAFL